MAGHLRKQRLFEYGELQTIISSKIRGVKRLSIHKFEVKETADFRPVILRGGSKHLDGNINFRVSIEGVVSHGYCLETGKYYDFKKANELYGLYKHHYG